MNFARVYGMATCAVVAFVGCGDDRVDSTSNTVAADSVAQPGDDAAPWALDVRLGSATITAIDSTAPKPIGQVRQVRTRPTRPTIACRALDPNHLPRAVDDTLAVDEDKTGTVNVLANDSDQDGDPLTATIATPPAHGTATMLNGIVSYRGVRDYNGADQLTYQISDGQGGTATARVVITVRPVNDRPSANHDFLTVPAGTLGSIDVALNDTDVDGDALVITAISQPAHGTATFTGTVVRYTSAASFSGQDSLEYTISDGHLTSTANVFVTVTAANRAPIAGDDQLTTAEDTEGDVFVLGNDSDPDGGTLTVVSFDQPAHGSVSITAGFAAYLPAANYNGPDSFHYTVQDPSGLTATATVNITVQPVDDAPVASDDAASVEEDASATIDVIANDRDIDGDPLTIISVTSPAHGSAAIVSGREITYTPAPNFHGSDSFTYTAADPSGATATATVTLAITSVNDAPVAVADAASLDEDTSATIDVVANDRDPDGDPLSITRITPPTHGSATILDATRVVYTPEANYHGPDQLSYTIGDGNGGEATALVTVTVTAVNDAPVAVDDTASTDEDAPVAIDVVANDRDVDGDALTVVAVTPAAHGAAAIADAHHVTYTPAPDFNGGDTFSYTIDDGAGGQATATVTVAIGAANDAPIATPDAASVLEDGNVTIDVVANDTDPDGDAITIAGVTAAAHGAVSVLDAHQVIYAPAENFHGSDSFTYIVIDPSGATARALVTIDVIGVNDAPVAIGDTAGLEEDTAVTVDVVGNDFDVDGDVLSIASITQPSHGFAMVIDARRVTYMPAPNFHGPDALTYTISDGHGGQATAELAFDVGSVNDAPTAVADAASLDEDTAVTVDVVANDADVDGDALTVTGLTPPAHGAATITDGHHVTYVPAPNFHGADALTYTISDGIAEATATLAFDVAGVNDTPVATDDAVSLDEDAQVAIDVVANDTDVDGDALTVVSVAPPAHGAAAIGDASHVSYTPAANYHGGDSFSYTVDDGHGGVASATVTLAIAAVNDAPVATALSATAFDDSPVTIALAASDVDGDPLTFAIVTAPAHGTLSGTAGHVTYTAAPGFLGADAFTYTASDASATSAVATVTLTVARSVCGNGAREGREECDDGNAAAGDGCEASCKLSCGSGTGADRAAVDPISGHCFAAYDSVHHSYQDAAALCAGAGGHLPTITTASEDATAFAAVHPGDRPWLGGDDIAVEGVFTWTTGEPLRFTNFQAGKPDSAAGADCLQYLADGTWGDATCADPQGTVSGTLCEIDLVTTTPAFTAGGGGTRGAAVADLNGDGYPDIATVNQAANTVGILLGNGAGSFVLQTTYPTGTGPTAIAAGDFDGDGHVDLAIVNAGANTIGILRGAANGAFTAGGTVAIPSGATSIATGDFDRDGTLDLVIGASNAVQVLRGNGSAGFALLSNVSITGVATAIAIGDFDHDGDLDLAVTTPTAVLVVTTGSGGLLGAPTTLASSTNNRAVTAADLDNDGNLDLAVVSGVSTVTLWFGSPSGGFATPTTLTVPGAQLVAAGDFDGDGDADLVALGGGYATLFRATGRTFTPAGPSITTGGSGASFAVAASLNGDAAQDLVVANTTTGTAGVLLGGAAGFAGARALVSGSASSSTASGDLNEDGLPDLVVVDPVAGTITIFLQTQGGALVQGQTLTVNVNAGVSFPTLADINRDGHLDLVVSNVNFGSIAVSRGTGTGTLIQGGNTGTLPGPRQTATGDFDGDGNIDIAVVSSNSVTNAVTLMINNGNGGFGHVTDIAVPGAPVALVVNDFNGDGKKDIAVATTGEATVKVLLGHGDKTFTLAAYPIASGSQAIAAGDLDGDGVIDLVAANLTASSVSILHGTGGGAFGTATSVAVGSQPSAVVAVDLDLDGHLDLVVGNAGTNDIAILRNNAAGGFAADRFSLGVPASFLTVADLDHDGHPDIVAASNNPFVAVLLSPR